MFVSYIQGVRNHWSGNACIAHYTSKNLWDWKYAGKPQINANIIDPTLYRTPDGTWKMWYKDQNRWNRMSLMNIANAGRFAADRAIRDYANTIWCTQPVK